MKMPTVRPSVRSNRIPHFLVGRNLLLIECSDVADDLATEQPQVVYVGPDRLLLQTTGNEMRHERTHCVEYALAVWNILLHSLPTLRPLGKVRADVFRCLHERLALLAEVLLTEAGGKASYVDLIPCPRFII